MNWLFALLFTVLAILPRTAFSDETRHPVFPSAIVGTWGETAEKCHAKDGSNVEISPGKYADGTGTCEVRWIVMTAGGGSITNYAGHSLCTSAKDATKTETVDIIVRLQAADRAVMGRSFNDLKTYQRCPAE
jgi:hypothetical protein